MSAAQEAARKVLGVKPDTDEKAVRDAYKKLARQWHPDRNRGGSSLAERGGR